MSERLVLLGRLLGTYEEWDIPSEAAYTFYGVVPTDVMRTRGLPAGDVSVLYDEGIVEAYDEAGAVVWREDVMTLLSGLPMEKPLERVALP